MYANRDEGGENSTEREKEQEIRGRKWVIMPNYPLEKTSLFALL